MGAVVGVGAELVGPAVPELAGGDGDADRLALLAVFGDQQALAVRGGDGGVGGGVVDLEGGVDGVAVLVGEGVPQGGGGGVDRPYARVGLEGRTGLPVRAVRGTVVVGHGQLRLVRGGITGVDALPRLDVVGGGAQAHVAACGLGRGPGLDEGVDVGVDPAVRLDAGAVRVATVCAEEWYWVQVGWSVHRDAVDGALVFPMVQLWVEQSVLPEWKFHRARFVSTINASWIGVVFHVMKDRAVRGVPSAFLVPGLPKSSSTSLDQSTVSPCCT
ncbi:hypothetical protein GCM10023238_01350 [Streptomyces heliomycini]